MNTPVRFTIHDLEGAPDDGCRYEIIDGDLHVSRQPDWLHQDSCTLIAVELGIWNKRTRAGRVILAPGVIFAVDQAVAPDLVWVSNDRLPNVVGDDGKFHRAPDLVVEVLSPGAHNQTRDRDLKLNLYSREGVREYWIVDWRACAILVYRRRDAALHLAATLGADDALTSPILPGFSASVRDLCPTP